MRAAAIALFICFQLCHSECSAQSQFSADSFSSVEFLPQLSGDKDSLQLPVNDRFFSFSAFYWPGKSSRYFFRTTLYYKTVHKNWKNVINLDALSVDYVKTLATSNTYYSIQLGKEFYRSGRKTFLSFNTTTGVFYYQFLYEWFTRSIGLAVSEHINFGFRFERVDLGIGLYMNVGYGYVKRFIYPFPDGYFPFKFNGFITPSISLTLKQ